MKQIVYLCAVFTIFFSCKDDFNPTLNPNFDAQCFVENEPEGLLDTCNYDNIPDSIKTEIFENGVLSNEVKEWFSYYCLDDEKIFFSQGEKEVSMAKEGITENIVIKYDLRLSDSLGEYIELSCGNVEFAEFSMSFMEYDYPLLFQMEAYGPRNGHQISYLNIYSAEPDPANLDDKINITHFSLVFDQGQVDLKSTNSHSNKKEINGRIFNDVYTYDSSYNPNHLKINYNKEFGIISITDLEGVEWVINE